MARLYSVNAIAQLAQSKKPPFKISWRPALMVYAAQFNSAAAFAALVDPCMLAAIVVRESGGQNILEEGVAPGPGCGVGLCQITSGVDWTDIANPVYPGYGALLEPNVNLRVCAEVFLEPVLAQFSSSHLAAFAAYNVGASGVALAISEGVAPDAWTTGGDYGADVFSNWINFNAASMDVAVEWATFKQNV